MLNHQHALGINSLPIPKAELSAAQQLLLLARGKQADEKISRVIVYGKGKVDVPGLGLLYEENLARGWGGCLSGKGKIGGDVGIVLGMQPSLPRTLLMGLGN